LEIAVSRRLLVGTNNTGKAREISALVQALDVAVVLPRDLGITATPPEHGPTFQANALLKGRFFSEAAGLPCLADDSGLEVDALAGRPGVFSSRYAPTDAERIARLLDEMRHAPRNERTARFVCAAALVDVSAGTEVVETGQCEGAIAEAPRGGKGFGYDPVFYLPDMGRTMAEITFEEKNARSHRGKALAALLPHIRRAFELPT